MAKTKEAKAKPSRAVKMPTSTQICSPSGKLLATTYTLPLAGTVIVYPIDERRRLLEQLSFALDLFYVHLPRKKAIYGFDPVRAIALLRLRVETLTDGEFHQNVAEILARVRDRHVVFYGRSPFGSAAALPFTIERCWDGADEIHVITKVDPGAQFKSLRVGARVNHWNGIPIGRYVRLTANLFDGGNEAAALARSLAFLTHRPLYQFGPPLEEWVDLRFTVNGNEAEERFTWAGFDPVVLPSYPTIGRNLTGFGGDLLLMDLQNARRVRSARESFDAAPPAQPTAAAPGVPVIQGQGAGGTFDYGTVTTGDGTFAYLRFWSFNADDVDDLVNALVPVLPTLPQDGLIFDMRGNVGGYIAAGERLLQLFCSAPIVPARFQFRITDATRDMAEASDVFSPWRPSFVESFGTGEEYTRGIPIEGSDEDYNKVGQKYPGPVVLISDALAYSTADIFAAGFIDNRIGKVICTDDNMAAAGSNNWIWPVVRLFTPDFRIDRTLEADIAAGKLTARVMDAFNAKGISLSGQAVVAETGPKFGGTFWKIMDGSLTHLVRALPWMSPDLEVYLARSFAGLADLPSGIALSVTIRRAVRVKANEGRILEDVGIVPDILYRMTLRDVIEQNQDMFERAGKELAPAVVA